jgi:hypothetical protein
MFQQCVHILIGVSSGVLKFKDSTFTTEGQIQPDIPVDKLPDSGTLVPKHVGVGI